MKTELVKNFTLTTHDLQLLVIACLDEATERGKDHPWHEDYERLRDLFADLNRKVIPQNDYTLDMDAWNLV